MSRVCTRLYYPGYLILMLSLTFLFGLLFALSGIGVVLAVRSLTRFHKAPSLSANTLEEVSVDRYRPMLRLLSDDDLQYLRVQPGFTPEMASQLRRQRCKIFRGYLRCLDTDFRCVCGALKLLILESRYDRPDLASALVRAQVSVRRGAGSRTVPAGVVPVGNRRRQCIRLAETVRCHALGIAGTRSGFHRIVTSQSLTATIGPVPPAPFTFPHARTEVRIRIGE